MPRSAKNAAKNTKVASKPVVQNDGIQRKMAERFAIATTSDIPVRTILKVDVSDIPIGSLQGIISQLLKSHRSAHPHHPVYICPVRNGIVQSEPMFEGAILGLVKDLCEVVDGQIVFKKRPPVDVDVRTFNL